jgi:hypothetical protein
MIPPLASTFRIPTHDSRKQPLNADPSGKVEWAAVGSSATWRAIWRPIAGNFTLIRQDKAGETRKTVECGFDLFAPLPDVLAGVQSRIEAAFGGEL